MDKMILTRSLCRSIFSRYQSFSSAAAVSHHVRCLHFASPSVTASSPNQGIRHPFAMHLGGNRSFSEDVAHMPIIKDSEIERAFKDLMATNWDELPPSVVHDVKMALTKSTDDKAAQEVLKNVYRAAAAVEDFSGVIMSLKMDMDDEIGASGEGVKQLPEVYAKALKTILKRHAAYLASFNPDESYLKKKVEMELGTKMIYLKMRCSGLGAEWGKVTVHGTSGLSGSYVEQRA